MKQLLLAAALLLTTATNATAQEKSYSEVRKEECAQMRVTPLGKARTEEIVRNCRFFIECGMNELDYINCARGSTIAILLFEMHSGGGGEDDYEPGDDDGPGGTAIMGGKGLVDYGDLTYGDLYDKLEKYTKSPKYMAMKERQEKLLLLQQETVTEESWRDARAFLMQNGYSERQTIEMQALWRDNKRQSWTYGELIRQYNGGNRNID